MKARCQEKILNDLSQIMAQNVLDQSSSSMFWSSYFWPKNSDYCRSPTWVLAKVDVSSLNQQTFPFYKSATLSKPRKVRLAMKYKLMFSKYYCYYVGVAHWIDLRLVVKFLEVLFQQNSSNLNNISEHPCRTWNGSFLQFHYSCLNPYVTQPLL